MNPLNYNYDYSFSQTPQKPNCWKERLAWILRRIADRLDRRDSFALKFESDPELPIHYRNRCIERGMEVALSLMAESVAYESMDHHLQSKYPELWQGPATNSEESRSVR